MTEITISAKIPKVLEKKDKRFFRKSLFLEKHQ